MNLSDTEMQRKPILTETQRADLSRVQTPLDKAATLPAFAYNDPKYQAAEEEYILRREWLSVGRVEDIPEPGDYFAIDILREPLIIVRKENGEIQALSNVCRHRAMKMFSGSGNTKRITCPYHVWNYDLDGQLLSAPKMEGNKEFDVRKCSLPKVRTEIWLGWIFINFDPDAEPLAPRLADLEEALEPYRISELKRPLSALKYEHDANWKLLTDNWENYHVLGIHSQTLLPVPAFTPDIEFPWKTGGSYSLWLNPFKEGASRDYAMDVPTHPGLPKEMIKGYVGVHVFPCHLFIISPEDLLYYKILPRDVGYFDLEVEMCAPPAVADDPKNKPIFEGRAAALETVHGVEDAFALDGTHAGNQSTLVEKGCLSKDEQPLWEFYNYLSDKILAGEEQRGA